MMGKLSWTLMSITSLPTLHNTKYYSLNYTVYIIISKLKSITKKIYKRLNPKIIKYIFFLFFSISNILWLFYSYYINYINIIYMYYQSLY